jgi:glucokinase
VAAQKPTCLRDRQPLSAASVYQAAAEGDGVALAITAQAGRAVGRALLDLMLAYDVERVVLGGGLARAGEAFLNPIQREMESLRRASPLARIMLPADRVGLLPAGYEAALWGAVTLAQQARLGSAAPRAQPGKQAGE